MKKLLVLIILFTVVDKIESQTWINNGATWHYNYTAMGSTGFYKISYEKDTLIEDKKCEKLITLKYIFGINPNNELVLKMIDR
jgi:hypothetical protein